MEATIPIVGILGALTFILIWKFGLRWWQALIAVSFGFFLCQNPETHQAFMTIFNVLGFVLT